MPPTTVLLSIVAVVLGSFAIWINSSTRMISAVLRRTPSLFGLVALALACLQLWVVHGGHVTAGGLSAVASFIAAGIALAVATRDRADRMDERAKAAEAQARLVVITAVSMTEDRLGINVDNFGREPILDVSFESAEIRTVTALIEVPRMCSPKFPT